MPLAAVTGRDRLARRPLRFAACVRARSSPESERLASKPGSAHKCGLYEYWSGAPGERRVSTDSRGNVAHPCPGKKFNRIQRRPRIQYPHRDHGEKTCPRLYPQHSHVLDGSACRLVKARARAARRRSQTWWGGTTGAIPQLPMAVSVAPSSRQGVGMPLDYAIAWGDVRSAETLKHPSAGSVLGLW